MATPHERPSPPRARSGSGRGGAPTGGNDGPARTTSDGEQGKSVGLSPGSPRKLTDAVPVCVAIAQVLLRHDSERHWARAAPTRIGHLFPRLAGRSECNRHLCDAAPVLLTAVLWPVRATPTR